MSENENPFAKYQRKEAIRRAGKKTKVKSNDKGARQKGIKMGGSDGWDEMESSSRERVMPRGERERRRQVEKIAAERPWYGEPAGEDEEEDAEMLAAPHTALSQEGTVIEVSSGFCRIEDGKDTLLCTLRGSLKEPETGFTNIVAVGDRVQYQRNGGGKGVIERVLPRHSALARPDVFRSHLKQVIVANADQLLIVMSWRDPQIWLELVDRYLITAMCNGLEAVLCLTKIDLVESQAELRETLQPYRDMDVPILLTSSRTGAGLDRLSEQIRGKMTILAGLSGVGKTSLLVTLQPDLDLRTGKVGESTVFRGQGKHTTTQVSLFHLENGATVVDTPGIREFGLASLSKTDLAGYYPEINRYAEKCRFRDCLHVDEPDCAVREAVKTGVINPNRYKNYQSILSSLKD